MPNRNINEIITNQQLVKATKKTSINQIANLMSSHHIGAVLIMEKEKLVGIVTERDLIVNVLAKNLDSTKITADVVMTKNPITIDHSKPFCNALHIMDDNNFRHLPVTKDGKVIGMVSARNALAMDLKQFEANNVLKEHIYNVIA